MQTSSQAFVDALKRSYNVSGSPTITIEWNLNRFGTVSELANAGTVPVEDDHVFPLSSIIDSRRPTKPGLIKGFVSTGTLGQEAFVTKSTSIPSSRRVYTATPDSKYKYWVSPSISSASLSGSGYALSNCSPSVTYEYALRTNKLVAQFENSGSSPVDVRVQITTDGSTWTNAGPLITPGPDGRIELYLQNGGQWSTTKNLSNVTPLRGIKLIVPRMDKPRVHAHVIEMALMREIDVTDRTIDVSFDYNASEASFIAPLGRAESAVGSLTLSNVDGALDNDRPGMDLYGMMNSPAKVTATSTTTAGEYTAETHMGTMYVETWGDQAEDERRLSLSDASMFLKQEYPDEILLEGATGTEVIWRLLDSVGFTDFVVDESPDGDMKVLYFWTDPEKTVWDHIKELSEAFQIAVYFDETGTLRIRTRERVYDGDKDEMEWVFDGSNVTIAEASEQGRPEDAGKLADIISISKPHELHANKITVEYTKTSISSINKFQPSMEQVWEPEGTVALRTASLRGSMSPTSTYGVFGGSDFATWPYEGMMQVDGEIMKWTKKRYRYLDEAGVWQTKYISSDAEKDVLDSKNDKKSHYNKFDGGLLFGENRGLMSTIARSHDTGHKFTAIRNRHGSGTIHTNNWYTRYDPANSVFRIQTSKLFSGNSFVTARRGQPSDAPPRYMGTSLRFDNTKAYGQGSAGVFLGLQSMDAAYYVEISLTSWAGDRRAYTNEVCLYVRQANGDIKRVSKGATAAIEKGQWYDLDVYQRDIGSGFQLSIMLNGQEVMSPVIPASLVLDDTMPGLYGVFARGHTHVEFEYLYAANSIEDVPFGGDESTRWDLITGGYRSNYYNHYLYKANINERLSWWSAERVTRNTGFSFDDFGTKGHELREFKVNFDPNPVVHSRLYLSNEWYADCLEYTADHNSATFIVAGKGRDNVILNGEDTLLYGNDSPVEQKMFVYGRLVKAEDTERYEVSNDKSIRRTGEVELSISSPWIQSEAAAKKIGDWIADHWTNGSEYLEIESFGNPLLQIGDIVGVSHLRKSMKPDKHQYYITGVSYSYKEGLTVKYKLQRKSGLIT